MSDQEAVMIVQSRHDENNVEKKGLLSGKSDERLATEHTTDSTKALAEKSKLSVFDTTLALVSATVGGEIVAIPFAVQRMGIWLGLFVIVAVAALSHISNMMYLKVKDLSGGRYESVYELAYALYGRRAIFFVCIVQYMLNLAGIVLYFIVLGDALESMTMAIVLGKGAPRTVAARKQELM